MKIDRYKKAVLESINRASAYEMTDNVINKLNKDKEALEMVRFLTEEIVYLRKLRNRIANGKLANNVESIKNIKKAIEPINNNITVRSLELKKYEQYFCDHPLWFSDYTDNNFITAHCPICEFKLIGLNRSDFEYGVHESHPIDNINPYTYGGPIFDDVSKYHDIAIEYNIAMKVDELYEVRHALVKNIERKHLKKVK